MGLVYECIDEQISRRVAVKKLLAEYASNSDLATRFFNEALAVNLVSHPSVVQISEILTDADGSIYLVMEFLAGETLSQRLTRRGGRLSETETLHILWQLASALDATHRLGIVHRDLKPSNIMLVPDPTLSGGERVKLVDFGIAKLGNRGKEHSQRTRTGVVMGTPAYMSPEQCCGASLADSKSDVYSLGVLLFELLTGDVPFRAEYDLAVLHMHVTQPAPALAACVSGISPALAELVEALLQKSPAARPSAAAVVNSARRMLLGHSSSQQLPLPAELVSPTPSRPPRGESTLRTGLGHVSQLKRKLAIPLQYGWLPLTILVFVAILILYRPAARYPYQVRQSPALYTPVVPTPSYDSIPVAATSNAPIPAAAPSQPKLDIKSTGPAEHIDPPVPDISIKAPSRPPPSLPEGRVPKPAAAVPRRGPSPSPRPSRPSTNVMPQPRLTG